MYNVLDFTQLLYFEGGVCSINKNNVPHSLFQTGKSHAVHVKLSTVFRTLHYLKIIQQDNLMSNKVLIIEELRLSSAIVLCECLPFNYYENKPNIPI